MTSSSAQELPGRVVHAEPEALESRLGAPYQLACRVLRRAMAKKPDLRFATIVEFAHTFQRALALAEANPSPVECAA